MTDEELIAWVRNGFGNVAADRIEALVKERDRQYDENVNRIHQQALAENRAERLEAALREIENMAPTAIIPWTHEKAANTYWAMLDRMKSTARAALKGADHE